MEYRGLKIEEIQEGINLIGNFIEEVASKTCEKPLYYQYPRYIYRGISKFYPFLDKTGKGICVPEEGDVEKDYIRSALAVRLDVTAKDSKLVIDPEQSSNDISYVKANYIAILQSLIRNAKKYYPDKYSSSMSDLDILADIQHNGGATCLVDFSKNILTALWFSCHSDFDADGFVYCYDVMNDMIVNDKLTYIKGSDEKKNISCLLAQTYRETNISSDVDTRFCLWEPSPRNNRILRQDSIFVFGIEKFKVSEHKVEVVRIHAKDKRKILLAMKGLFNISSNTIFNDYVGFSNANDKKIPYYKMNDISYNRGYIDMLKGNYFSALDFLKLHEGKELYQEEESLTLKDSLELHFSLAVCYKNLKRQEGKIVYIENAILEYREVVDIAKRILNGQNLDEKERDYYILKCSRAYNGILDMLYMSKNYHEAIIVCDELIAEISNGILCNKSNSKLSRRKEFNSRYCEISKMELLDLFIIQSLENSVKNDFEEEIKKMESCYNSVYQKNGNSYFDNLLILYYKFVFDILIDKEVCLSENYRKRKMVEMRKELRERKKEKDPYKGYILWNFSDIKEAIDNMKNEYFAKKYYLQYATAYIISFRDAFEVRSCRSQEY